MSSDGVPFIAALSTSGMLGRDISPSSRAAIDMFVITSRVAPFAVRTFNRRTGMVPMRGTVTTEFGLFVFLFLVRMMRRSYGAFRHFLQLILSLSNGLSLDLNCTARVYRDL